MRNDTLVFFFLGISAVIGLDDFVVTDRPKWPDFVVTENSPLATTEPVVVQEVEYYTMPGCKPCIPVGEDDKAGKFKGLFILKRIDITQQTPPPGITTVPAFRWSGDKASKWIYPRPEWSEDDPRRGYPGAKTLIEMWRKTQPKSSARAPPKS